MIPKDFVTRIEIATHAALVEPATVQALLNEARTVPILNEADLQEILPWMESLGRRLLATGESDLGLSAFTAAADVTVSTVGRGLPPRLAVILSYKMFGIGLQDASLQLLAETRSAIEKSGGPDLPLYLAHIDNTIGDQLRRTGDLDLAEESLQLALGEFEARPDGPPALHASILSNLGSVLFGKGVLDEAAEHLRAALQIDATQGEDSTGTAIVLDNLASVELELAGRANQHDPGEGHINLEVDGHLRAAEDYLSRARSAFQRALPDREAEYGICLSHLADLARYKNDTESADSYSQEALEILERVGDQDILWAVRSLRAAILYEHGNWQAVVDLLRPFTQAPVIRSAATALTYLARSAARLHDRPMSLQAATIVAVIDNQLLFDRMQAISESEALHVFGPFRDRLEIILGLGLAAKAEGAIADWLYEVALNRTGLLSERFGAAWIKVYSAKGAPADLADRVRKLRAAAIRMDLDGANATSIRDARSRHSEAARDADLAETDLLRTIGLEARMPALVAANDVRAVLNADSMLLDFALVQTLEGMQHYAVFIVRNSGPVEFRDLGPVAEIEELIGSLGEALQHPSSDRQISWGAAPETLSEGAAEKSSRDAIEKLSALIFPHDLHLPPNVRVSPIGLWSQVPFSLLAVRGFPLIENHLVSYVPSGRWLGARAMSSPAQNGSASLPVVMGDPDYNLESRSDQPVPLEMRFKRLEHAANEVKELAARLHVDARTGKGASNSALASLRSPAILHLATHGTMLEAVNSIAELSEPREAVIKSVGGVLVTEELAPSKGLGFTSPGFGDDSLKMRRRMRARWLKEIGPQDPRSRSIIVLAGANAWLAGRENPPEIGTGLMTAGEFALTDLTSTELVVLSACETGDGAVSIGDGTLLGLRSASLLAGSASCLSALWTVDDKAATDLMLAFYAGLERGAARDAALREAQLMVRAERPDPYYWAAWILDGNNGPLDKRLWNSARSQQT